MTSYVELGRTHGGGRGLHGLPGGRGLDRPRARSRRSRAATGLAIIALMVGAGFLIGRFDSGLLPVPPTAQDSGPFNYFPR